MTRLTFYGRLGDVMGRTKTMSLPAEINTARKLMARLCEESAEMRDEFARAPIRIAVNAVIVDPDSFITDGDEIDFLPPFSGG